VAHEEKARLMQQVQPKEMAWRIEGFESRGYDPADVKLVLPDAAFDSKMTIHLGGREIRFFLSRTGPASRGHLRRVSACARARVRDGFGGD
jgi:hypothetical protein